MKSAKQLKKQIIKLLNETYEKLVDIVDECEFHFEQMTPTKNWEGYSNVQMVADTLSEKIKDISDQLENNKEVYFDDEEKDKYPLEGTF